MLTKNLYIIKSELPKRNKFNTEKKVVKQFNKEIYSKNILNSIETDVSTNYDVHASIEQKSKNLEKEP